MSLPAQTTQATKAGTSSNSTNETKADSYPTRQEIAQFMDAIHTAKAHGDVHDIPCIDAATKIVRHFNQGRSLKGLEEVGYFVYDGVKVFEEGRRVEAMRKDALTSEDKVFGGKK